MTHKARSMMIAAAALFSAASIQTVFAQAPATPQAAPAAAKPAAAAPAEKPTFESILAFLPDTVAEIGNKKITKQQLIADISRQIPVEAFSQIPAEQVKTILKNIVDGMVDQEILMINVEKAGIKPSPELVSAAFDKMMKSLPPERAEMFTSMLKQRGKTLEAYKAELAKDPNAQKGIAINNWVESNISNKPENAVSDAEVEKFYREHQESFATPESISASHILIDVKKTDDSGKALSPEAIAKNDADALKKAQDILAKLKQGESFEKIAEQESACPSGKQNKGSLGQFSKGQMVPEFEEAAFALQKKGQLSDVVKTPYGYHIIRLDSEKKPASFKPLAEVKDEIKNYLTQMKIEKAVLDVIVKEKANLKVKVNGFDAPSPAAAPAAPAAPAAKK